MTLKVFFLPAFLIMSFTAVSQAPVKALQNLATRHQQQYDVQTQKVLKYASDRNMPVSFTTDDGGEILMTEINENGIPVYRTTFNTDAAAATGAARLHNGGGEGLNLSGDGITVGVWDGGRVKQGHVEFGNRIVSVQGSTVSSHAMHVTGTILASGIVTAARGMAPLAKATTWDYANDEAEIASLAGSLLFSNHSYGTLCGWYYNNGWIWAGDPSVSSSEDYRFGFYSNRSRLIDEIAFNAPHYTMIWAAGNDRNTPGNGIDYPPDGNGGTGYDCLHPDAVAKNIITVGAISKLSGSYTGPASVDITDFSSWGPTDDGRIKPDLVGVGHAVYSTNVGSGGSDSYSYESGTSMAAPNVTGSLVLLQELYSDLHAGNYMKAATLKALAIHTAREAGDFPGPDYSFGWGLLDVDSAARILLAEDQYSVMVSENRLLQGQTQEFEIQPRQNTAVTITIAWTDPAGTPVSASLDPLNRMLVNDLDLRLVDDDGNIVYPWMLNPASPSSAASRGDNFRDNVEKIQFTVTAQRPYKIQVNHKGLTLVNGAQDFSLILSYTPVADSRTTFYWIGDSGDWHDPANWSLTSGGAPAGTLPDANSKVYFDENSFSGDDTVTLQADASCSSFRWLAKNGEGLSLNGFTLFVHGTMTISPKDFVLRSGGTIQFSNGFSDNAAINSGGVDLSSASIVIDAASSTFTVNGGLKVSSINLVSGNLVASNTSLEVNSVVTNSSNARTLDLTGTIISNVTALSFTGTNLNLLTEDAVIELKPSANTSIAWNGIIFGGSLRMDDGELNFTGPATVHKLMVDGELLLNGNNTVQEFEAAAGSDVKFNTGSQQTFTHAVGLNSLPSNKVSLSTQGAGTSEIYFDGHYKSCFDYVDISNVNVSPVSRATISAGVNSTFINASNWSAITCDDAMFPDFTVRYNCAGAISEFINRSEGNIASYTWNFGDPLAKENTSEEENAVHTYTSEGTYTVELTVDNGTSSKSYSLEIEIIVNDLDENKVIISNDKLFSFHLAQEYQWYRNKGPIAGATSRSYDYKGDQGTYFVLIKSESCNIPSEDFVVSSVEEQERHSGEIAVFPNPAATEVTLNVSARLLPARVYLTDIMGQTVYSDRMTAETLQIFSGAWSEGVYILSIFPDNVLEDTPASTRLVIRHD